MSSYLFKKTLKFFFFGNDLSAELKKKILKLTNANIIYQNHKNLSDFLQIMKFCKKNNIKLYISDNIKLSKKYKVDGIHISSQYKKRIFINIKKLDIIGTVHNQMEFDYKLKQGCSAVFLSPIFKTQKYSENKVLGISKFNLLTSKWPLAVYALGGVNDRNIKKIALTKANGIGGISYFK